MKHSYPIFALCCWLLTMSVAASLGQSSPHYAVTDLGLDLHTSESGPVGINDSGDIAGTMDAPAPSLEHRAFVYHRGKITLLSNQDLRAAAINNRGQVACFSPSGVFLWDKRGTRELTPRPTLFGSSAGPVGDLSVTGLNDHGQIIGTIVGLDGVFKPFFWRDGKFEDDFSGRDDQRSSFSPVPFVPCAMNDRGQVAGVTPMRGGTPTRAILWDNGRIRAAAGSGALSPNALNNKGQSVGTMSVGNQSHAFFWDGSSNVRDLGTAGGVRSEADGINDRGQIVGTADIQYQETNGLNSTRWGGGRAILWQDGQAYNLTNLLPKGSGWLLEKAIAINNRGQIVCTGHRSRDGRSVQGSLRILLLTPQK